MTATDSAKGNAGTRFLESLDSVHNTEVPHAFLSDSLTSLNQIYAELEVFLTFLIGDEVMLAENQSFDSDTFLGIARRAIRLDGKSRRPFQLKLRPRAPYKTFRNMVVTRMLDQNYHLSLLGSRDHSRNLDLH